MKKLIYLILFVLTLPLISLAETSPLDKYNTPSFRIGVWNGSSFEELAKTKFPNATLVYFKDSTDDLIEALCNNQIDSFIFDRIAAVDLLKENKDLTINNTPIDKTQYAMAFHPENKTLRDEFAIEIKKMKQSGELQKLQQDWFSDETISKKTRVAPHGSKGVLKVGTSSIDPPFSFFLNNKLVGIEIELVNRIAERLDYSVEWSIINHASFVSALKNKEIDIEAGLTTITPERQKQILFGEPDYEDTVVFVTKK